MNKEVDAFMRKARRSLKASQVLIAEDLAEDATGRAYYAMLSAAKAMLLTLGRKPTQHRHVKREFESQFVATGKVEVKFLRLIEGGFMSRHFAEYESDLTHPIDLEDAQARLREAQEFVGMAEDYLKAHGT